MQRLQQRLALRLANGAALLGRLAVDRGLDGVQLADPSQSLFGDRRLGRLVHLEQPPPGMRHAGDMGNALRPAGLRRESVVAGIGIGVQPARKPRQVLSWSLALAPWRVSVERRRWS